MLLQVIKANDDLTPEHHQFFLYQLLRGLKYIHPGEELAVCCINYNQKQLHLAAKSITFVDSP